MKKYFSSLAVACFLAATAPAHATLIIYGVFSGVVIQAQGSVRTAVGMPVSGTFSYDYDLLAPSSVSGCFTVGSGDPNATFFIQSSAGEGGGGNDMYGFLVDAHLLPYLGSAGNAPYVGLSSSYVAVSYDATDYWAANVNYTITSLPDGGTTWLLLGLGLASVAVARHCFRQTPV